MSEQTPFWVVFSGYFDIDGQSTSYSSAYGPFLTEQEANAYQQAREGEQQFCAEYETLEVSPPASDPSYLLVKRADILKRIEELDNYDPKRDGYDYDMEAEAAQRELRRLIGLSEQEG